MLRGRYITTLIHGMATVFDVININFSSNALVTLKLYTINKIGKSETHYATLVDTDGDRKSQLIKLDKHVSCIGLYYDILTDSMAEIFSMELVNKSHVPI